MITTDKVTEFFCIIDEFDKGLESELKRNLLLLSEKMKHRNLKASLRDNETMVILLLFHFETYRSLKSYYPVCIRGIRDCFPEAVSHNRFVELPQRVFFKLTFFLKLFASGRCAGISFARKYDMT